jgi:hypothetical protein
MSFGRLEQSRGLWKFAIILTVFALAGLPAWADDDDEWDDDDSWYYYKKYGGTIDPTNFPVIDIDIDFDKVTDQPAAAQIKAAAAHATSKGTGVVVAVLDAGFNLSAPQIASNLHPLAYDAIDDDFDPNDSGNGIDDDGDGHTDPAVGHGTFVAGMVLMSAPEALIMPIRVADDEGYGSSYAIREGIEFAVSSGASVINLSMTVSDRNYIVRNALQDAEAEGVTVVVSGGNDGVLKSDDIDTIAMLPYVIGVGAVDSTDMVAEFTTMAQDEWMKAFAPGVDLWGPLGEPDDDMVAYWSGTSFSAGIVSGAVALYLDTHTDWDPQLVRTAMHSCADPVYRPDGTVLPNAGRIDLERIVD